MKRMRAGRTPNAPMLPDSKMFGGQKSQQDSAETANTTIMLVRFCVTIDIVDAAWTGGELVLDFLRFGFFGVVFTDIAFPGNGGSGRLAT